MKCYLRDGQLLQLLSMDWELKKSESGWEIWQAVGNANFNVWISWLKDTYESYVTVDDVTVNLKTGELAILETHFLMLEEKSKNSNEQTAENIVAEAFSKIKA